MAQATAPVLDSTEQGIDPRARNSLTSDRSGRNSTSHEPASRIARVIRFGVMCDGRRLEAWQADCVRQLLELDNVRLALLIVDPDAGTSTKPLRKVPFHRWLYTLYRRSWFRGWPRQILDQQNIFRDVPQLTPTISLRGKSSQIFDAKSVATIASYNLDFILRFGFNIIRGEILEVPRYGVWSFHHDDEKKYRGSPAGFWEIYYDDPVTGAILQRLTDRLDAGIVLRRGFFRTVRHSYVANISQLYGESAAWPAQICREIRAGRVSAFAAEPSCADAPMFYPPTNLQMLRFMGKLWSNQFHRIARLVSLRDHWNIGIVDAPIRKFLDPNFSPHVHWLLSQPSRGYFADPFHCPETGANNPKPTTSVMVEEYDYAGTKGSISWLSLRKEQGSLRIDDRGSAIALPMHLSYPYIFRYDGVVYCVPECWQSRGISLYRAVDPPRVWQKLATLVDAFDGVDPTLFQHEGRWWLLCSSRRQGSLHNLFIWYADALLGPWRPHDGNPVKNDVRSSRPAGTPFVHEGHLYRPTQDCSSTYGGRVMLNRINKLTPEEFAEESVREISPIAPYSDGVHTLSSCGEMTLIDGKRVVIKFPFRAIRYGRK
jgi:hypothetical protein